MGDGDKKWIIRDSCHIGMRNKKISGFKNQIFFIELNVIQSN